MSGIEDKSRPTLAAANSDDEHALTAGCLFSLGSALVTGMLLFINGSLVLAILKVLDAAGLTWVTHQGFSQFVLFVFPVALVVVEWLMIDYVRTRFHSHRTPLSDATVFDPTRRK